MNHRQKARLLEKFPILVIMVAFVAIGFIDGSTSRTEKEVSIINSR